jgi:formylglycine-generating enzyme required for sulfatase activity
MPKKTVWETYRDQVLKKEIARLDELAGLYDHARQFHQQGQWQAVREIIARIKTVKPDYPDPEKLLVSAEKEIAAQEKRAKLDVAYASAQEAIFNGRWLEAQRLLRQVEKGDPKFHDITQLLAYVDATVNAKRQAAQKKREARLAAQLAAKSGPGAQTIDISPAQAETRLFQQWLGIVIGLGLLGILTWIFITTLPYWSIYIMGTATPTPTKAIPMAMMITGSPNATLTPQPDTSTPTPLTPTSTASFIPTMTLTTTLGAGSIQIVPKDGMQMVYVPEGKFLMGSEQRKIYLNAYWIDRVEVTNAMFAQCVIAGVCKSPKSKDYGVSLYGDYPVIWVSWLQAETYCQWAGRRLPTEAEWEKAARGVDGRIYPWGNNPIVGNLLNFCDNNCNYEWKTSSIDDGFSELAPVGNYPSGASPYGAMDMAGNVLEWVADWYQMIIPANSPTRNPLGPSSGTHRSLRGGSFNNTEFFVRVFARSGNEPNLTYGNVGFRCAKSQ